MAQPTGKEEKEGREERKERKKEIYTIRREARKASISKMGIQQGS